MRKFATALTLASSLALPAAAVRGQESSSGSQSSRQQQQAQQRESQQQQRESQQQESESQRQSRQSGSASSSSAQQQQPSQQRQRQQAQDRQSQQEAQRGQSESQSQSQSDAQSQQSQSPRNVLLQGTIVDTDTINLQGHGYQHVFATVRSDQSGRTFLVDLGTRSELQRLAIEPGQKIAITGQMGPFRDTQLIVALEAQQGDRSAAVRRGQGGAWSQFAQQQQQMQDCPLCAAKASNQQQGRQQQQQQQQQQQRSQSNQTAQSQQQSQQQQSVSGTLVDARSIQLRGQQDRHVLAKIQTDQGRTIIADLGPRRNLRDFQPTRGSEIEVSGTRGTINGRNVLLADRASAGDQSVNIRRSGSQDAQQTRQSQQPQQQRRQQQQQSRQTAQLQQGQRGNVEGRLVSTVAMDFGAQSPTFVLGTLETQDGQRVLVDLGTLQDIQDAQLRLGEELRASGRVTQLNGVPVVIARQIEDDGQTITIDRQSPDVEQTVRSRAQLGDGGSSSTEPQQP